MGEVHFVAFADHNESQTYVNITELPLVNDVFNTNNLKKQLEQIVPSNTYNNVTVSNSSNVVFGNVVKVKGVLNINLINEAKRSKTKREQFKEKENFKPFDSDQSSNGKLVTFIEFLIGLFLLI